MDGWVAETLGLVENRELKRAGLETKVSFKALNVRKSCCECTSFNVHTFDQL